jgi:hypothetical protein
MNEKDLPPQRAKFEEYLRGVGIPLLTEDVFSGRVGNTGGWQYRQTWVQQQWMRWCVAWQAGVIHESQVVESQVAFNQTIGALDQVLSEVMEYSRTEGLGDVNKQTLKHRIEDMELCAASIRKRLGLGPNSQQPQAGALDPVQSQCALGPTPTGCPKGFDRRPNADGTQGPGTPCGLTPGGLTRYNIHQLTASDAQILADREGHWVRWLDVQAVLTMEQAELLARYDRGTHGMVLHRYGGWVKWDDVGPAGCRTGQGHSTSKRVTEAPDLNDLFKVRYTAWGVAQEPDGGTEWVKLEAVAEAMRFLGMGSP